MVPKYHFGGFSPPGSKPRWDFPTMFGVVKLGWGLPDGENFFTIALAVLSQYRRVTHTYRQTDRHIRTPMAIARLTALRGQKRDRSLAGCLPIVYTTLISGNFRKFPWNIKFPEILQLHLQRMSKITMFTVFSLIQARPPIQAEGHRDM